MKKKLIATALISMLIFVFVGCGVGKDKLVGSWAWDGTSELDDKVCIESVTFDEDHTCLADGLSCNWSTDGDTLTITSFLSSETYTYKIDGSKLILDGTFILEKQ